MTRRGRQHNLATDEAMTLRYIDGDVTEAEAEAIVAHFATGSATAARRIEAMRDDRQALADLESPNAPSGMIEDVLSSVERSLLLDDDPVAPVVRYPSRSKWTVGRFAAAAVILLLASVAVIIIRQSLLTLDNRPDLVENPDDSTLTTSDLTAMTPDDSNLTEETPSVTADEAESNAGDRVAQRETRAPLPPITDLPGPDSIESTNVLTDEHAALLAGAVDTVAAVEGSSDLGLRLRIETADLGATLLELVEQLESSETELAQNAEMIHGRIETSPVEYYASPQNRQDFEENQRVPRMIQRLIDGDVLSRLRDHLQPSVRVPIRAQLDYQKEGYQWVLVGTFSEIRRLRDDLHRRRDHQALWIRPEGIGRIDDFMPPERPTAAEWGAIVLWWHNPQERWSLIERTQAAYEPEAIIRVPVRFEIRPELDRSPERTDSNSSTDR